MDLTEAEVGKIAAHLSGERIAAFIRLAGTERDAVALHDQMMRVGAALMPVTGLIEIALRNAICENLRATFGSPDWLTNPPPPFRWKGEELASIRRCSGWARRAAYAKLSQAEKKALDASAFPGGVPNGTSHEARSKGRQRVTPVTSGQLIAQLTLFFWKRLFSSDYEAALWKRSLRKLFPRKDVTRASVATHLETIYQARNRIAHHEPIIGERLSAVLEAIDFVVLHFETKTPSDAAILARLTRSYRLDLQREATNMQTLVSKFIVAPP